MKSFKLKLSTIQFENLEELESAIFHLERVRLTHLDHVQYMDQPKLTKQEMLGQSLKSRFDDSSNIYGVMPVYDSCSEKFTLDICTDGGIVAALVQSHERADSDTIYNMGSYFDFLGFFEQHAKCRHPIVAILESYNNGILENVETYNLHEYSANF